MTKDEILAVYRGSLKKFTNHMKSVSSSYVLDFDENGVTYRIDGENAENTLGSIGHIVNSIVGLEESKYNVYFEYSPEHKAFLVRANYNWNSGNMLY